jgi:hypothetical protein
VNQRGQFSQDGLWWWDGHQWRPAVSQDGRWRWNGQEWVPSLQTSRQLNGLNAALVSAYPGAGLVTLIGGFVATGLAGPSTLLDWILPASWLAIGIALIVGGIGLAYQRPWWYWVGTVGVLLPSAVYPWAIFDLSRTLANSGETVGVSVTGVTAGEGTRFYAAFLACLVVALIAVSFRRRWPRWLALPAAVFMGISCFELPAAVALVAGLVLDKRLSKPPLRRSGEPPPRY